VKALQEYRRRNAPSSLQIYSETQKYHLCEIKNYYHTVTGAANHRADAVVFMDTDPFHPWFLDFVQAQIDVFDEDRVFDHLNASHRAKITALVRDHEGIPRTSIIPMAFASNGVFHPAALMFIDWFLVQAARTPINEPPAIEKLKVLNAMCAAIVDQTATILTSHFSQFITVLHNQSFPLVLASASQPLSQRSSRRALFPSQNAALSSLSQPVEPTPPIHAASGSLVLPQSTPPQLSRSSERIRLRGDRGGVAVGLGGRW
jgi:hypothetical protein